MKKNDLIAILHGDIELIDRVNVGDVAEFSKNDVLIRPGDVREMLLKFLKHEVSSEDLTKWAMFICLRSEYVCVPEKYEPISQEFDQIGDYYEDMMYVIQKLSTPQIDGEINEKSVREYLSELEKYRDEFERGVHTFF